MVFHNKPAKDEKFVVFLMFSVLYIFIHQVLDVVGIVAALDEIVPKARQILSVT